MAKIAESQTLILAKFAGKLEPNSVADLKMMRGTNEEDIPDKLDYRNAPTPNYTMEDIVKMVSMKNPILEGGDEAAYKDFVNQVAYKVRELEVEYIKLSEKLPVKLEDIFEPTIKINLGVNEITALCDLGVSFLTIPRTLFDKLNLDSYNIIGLKLHLVDCTFKQAVGIKENIVVQIKGSPELLDLVVVDMPKDPIAPIILGRPF